MKSLSFVALIALQLAIAPAAAAKLSPAETKMAKTCLLYTSRCV